MLLIYTFITNKSSTKKKKKIMHSFILLHKIEAQVSSIKKKKVQVSKKWPNKILSSVSTSLGHISCHSANLKQKTLPT